MVRLCLFSWRGWEKAADPALQGQYDLVIAFECLHGMARPVEALRAMRSLAANGGTVVIPDERVNDTFRVRLLALLPPRPVKGAQWRW